ncbi:hypothetical protein DLAC_05786 [Tieghemostelium lacteum]|uniref:Uncharacterized protein n=1 Tax=Tieghemostelium lacteum TaxID=361077 RepID=A0A151ZGQ7_TIELA|nr:hypothetical protein DLAC_05786 [Tieghemostelium lacteum]|eukprot:KYQ93153.1 hypothetical protein DLAC_05786 [Tieghemostelium lacteum]
MSTDNQQTETTTHSSSSNIQPQTHNIFTLTENTTTQQIIDQIPNIPKIDISIIEKNNINGSTLLDPRVTMELLTGSLKISLTTALGLDNLRTTGTPIDRLSKISTEELEKELLSRKRKFSVLEEDEISNVQNAGEENLLSGTHFLSSKFSSMHIQTSVQQ